MLLLVNRVLVTSHFHVPTHYYRPRTCLVSRPHTLHRLSEQHDAWVLVIISANLDRSSTNFFTGRFLSKSESSPKRRIAFGNATRPHRYGNSHAIRDHMALLATRQRWYSRLTAAEAGTRFSGMQGWVDLGTAVEVRSLCQGCILQWPSW